MSYIALARKWRPRTFSQLVGQDHINKALINSLNQNRLHHAYLFTGTRGVGKTSIARLLAKAINCESGITAEPCLTCEACLAIEQGRYIDLIEIDGASRTRVEDTREILENVQYAPTSGRFKIYLIDEVHMLSQHSFNALLKTLEEPPAHVKFILATTDPQKLPVTVLSRCLQFNLKHMKSNVISDYLANILAAEKIPYEPQALELLSHAAQGSMRDALSLLDQAIASCNNQLLIQDVKASLGYTQQDYALQLLEALVDLSAEKLLSISRKIAEEGGHFKYVLDEILHYLHQISINLSLPSEHQLITSIPSITAISQYFTPEDVQLFYQIALKGTQDIMLAPTMSIGFEMTLLRMLAFKPTPKEPMPVSGFKVIPHNKNIISSIKTTELSKPEATLNLSPEKPLDQTIPSWALILNELKLSGLAQNAAEQAEWVERTPGQVILRVDKGHLSVFTSSVLSRIEDALGKYFKEKIKLVLTSDQQVLASPQQQKDLSDKKQHQDSESALQNDPFFQQLQQEFSGMIVKNSISPRKDSL